jgi:DNA-nicking Smr family endonuclease
LQQEYDNLQIKVNSTTIHSNPNWLANKQQMSELLKQLMAARENAHNDIYERMNSCGSMGINLSGQSTAVDLHGLGIEAAKRFIQDPILAVLPVLKKIMVITGRGVHSQSGECVIKQGIHNYLKELEVKFEEVKGNDGAIYVYA